MKSKKRAFVRYANNQIVAGSLILADKAPKVGVWREVPEDLCCIGVNPNNNTKSFDFDIANFKDNLGDQTDSCNLVIRTTITGINLFYDDNSGDLAMIGDGGGDMYDGGNALNTNYTQLYNDIKDGNVTPTFNIPYTHTQASSYTNDFLYITPPMDGGISDGSSYFGNASQYFTNMYPGLFMMVASGLNGVTQFSICGNLGTDGYGTNFYYKQPTSYIGWTGYYKTNNDKSAYNDPSVNHMILVKGPSSDVQQVGDVVGSWDDHAVLNLTDDNTDIIVLVFSTLPSTPPVTKEQFRSIADMILDVAAGTDPCNG